MSGSQSGLLRPGQAFATTSGRQGQVGALLGAGGQGEVYSVGLDGQTFALKWYHPHYAALDTSLRSRLDRAVRRGAPTEDFLWPLDLVDIPASQSFGYVMLLRSDDYVSIRDLIAPPPRRLEMPLARRATICQQLASSFLQLHANGFCYQDVNFGNIFLDPRRGRVLICDNDNVNIDGADASIYGTRKFMAPEVVRREALPNSRTDLFSMSVLFFYTLFGWHPLDGRREAETKLLNAAAEMRLYGEQPLFLFDPVDTANGPVPGLHDALVARWNSLPSRLRSLFERAFGQGLNDPASRVLETEWRGALRIVEEASFACPSCGFEHVAEPNPSGAPGLLERCLACAEPLVAPAFLQVRDRLVAMTVGQTLDGEILDRKLAGATAGRVEAHPQHPDRIGLRNLTGEPWRAILGDGASYTVPPGQVVRVLPGATIDFGRNKGRISARATARGDA